MNDREIGLDELNSFKEALITEMNWENIEDVAALGFDFLFSDDGIFNIVPPYKIILSIIKNARTISERFEAKKRLVFLQQLSKGNVNEKEIKKRQDAYRNKSRWFEAEAETISIYISRFIRFDKVKLFAELYIDFLNNQITVNEFGEFADIIERMLISDATLLLEIHEEQKLIEDIHVNIKEKYPNVNTQFDAVGGERLVSLGLLCSLHGMSFGTYVNKSFVITPQGKYLSNLIIRYTQIQNTKNEYLASRLTD